MQSREAILRLAAIQRRRLPWRHLLPLSFALLTMLVCTVGIGEGLWPGFRGLVGDKRDTVRASWQIWAAIYLCAAMVACVAAARFDVRLAIRRFPVVLILASVAIALFLLVWIAGHLVAGAGDESSTGGTSDGAALNDDSVRRTQPPPSLATALLEPIDAELALGAPVGTPSTKTTWVSRSASICFYSTLGNSASLTLIVYRSVSRWVVKRLLRRGSPVAGIGDMAVDDGDRLYVSSGEYLVMLSTRRRDRERTDRRPLISAARRVTDRLPTTAELDAADRELFGRGWRGWLNSLFATIGLPIR